MQYSLCFTLDSNGIFQWAYKVIVIKQTKQGATFLSILLNTHSVVHLPFGYKHVNRFFLFLSLTKNKFLIVQISIHVLITRKNIKLLSFPLIKKKRAASQSTLMPEIIGSLSLTWPFFLLLSVCYCFKVLKVSGNNCSNNQKPFRTAFGSIFGHLQKCLKVILSILQVLTYHFQMDTRM